MTIVNKPDLTSDPEFLHLEKTQSRLSFGYTAAALGLFATLVVSMVYWPELLARHVLGDSEITLALVGALLLIIGPLLIAALYLRAVERQLDPIRRGLKARLTQQRRDL